MVKKTKINETRRQKEVLMKIPMNPLKSHIEAKLNQFQDDLSQRIYLILEEFIKEDLNQQAQEEIDCFQMLIELILKADQTPALLIADLLTLVDSDNCCHIDHWTLTESASFLKDYLKKEDTLHILRKIQSEEQKE